MIALALTALAALTAHHARERTTSFEEGPVGAFTELATGAGQWAAPPGHAAIQAEHTRTGERALHIAGGDGRFVILTPATDEPISELTFWAERWTRRDPFEFRVEARRDGAWEEVYVGDDKVLVGGFHAFARVPLHASIEALRFTCTSPAGVIIDDVRLGRDVPMEVVSVAVGQPIAPCLVDGGYHVVSEVVVRTSGALEPLDLLELDLDLTQTTSLADVERVVVLGGDGEVVAGEAPHPKLTLLSLGTLTEGENRFPIAVRLAPGADLDHRVDVGCTRVELVGATGGGPGPELRPPVPNPPGSQRIGLALRDGDDDGVAVYRIPGIVTTNAGTLLAVYDARHHGWADLPADVDVALSRSTDGGRTWEPMRVILDMGDDPEHRYDGVGDPSILVDRETGTVWVAAVWSHGDRGWHGSGPGLAPDETGQLVLTKSDDDGRTWSAPINITAEVKDPAWAFLLQGPGRGISMRDGTLVFPAQFQSSPATGRVPSATVLVSTDHGETWRVGAPAKANTTEAQVVETEPGVLMLNMRDNRGGTRSIATTRDLGATWVEHPTSRSALIEPVCNAALIRAGERTLLFCNPNVAAPPRRDMTLRASLDLGQSWPEELRLLLDAGESAGYPALTMIDAETVGVLFEGSRAQLTFLRVPLAEVVGR